MDSILFQSKLFLADRDWNNKRKNSLSVKLTELEALIEKRKETMRQWNSDKLPAGVLKSGVALNTSVNTDFRDDSDSNRSESTERDFEADLSSDD